MMGVSFDPGQQDQYRQGSGPNAPSGGGGIQEAIKILSLRLPRVVGANAVSPQALLSSPGAGGNPRVDSVVQQVLAKFFPQATGAPPMGMPMPPSAPMGGSAPPWSPAPPQPSGGDAQPSFMRPRKENTAVDYLPFGQQKPHIVVDKPLVDFSKPYDNGTGVPPGSIAPPPQLPTPWSYEPPQNYREPEF